MEPINFKKINWFTLIGFIIVIEAIGVLSGFLAGNISETYGELIKPPLSPPGIVFGIVWPILYALMGISVYFIYESKDSLKRTKSLILFGIQLFLNFSWSIIFFRFELFWIGVLIIITLDLIVGIIIYYFNRIYKLSGYLLIPYYLWIIFATYLSIAIAYAN